MSTRKACFCLAFYVIVGVQAYAQTAESDCLAGAQISLRASFDDSDSSVTMDYELRPATAFSSAWIEVRDRPKLLYRTQVPVSSRGRTSWAIKDDVEDTPHTLTLAVYDPALPNETNDSRVLVATLGPVEGGPVPGLIAEAVLLEEETDSPYVIAGIQNLGEHNTLIRLDEQESPETWIARKYLAAVPLDLAHVRVEIPAGYLAKPTVLKLVATRVGDESLWPVGSTAGSLGLGSFTIYVMSKDRPSLSSVEPSEVSADETTGATVRILGDGFTKNSQVLAGFEFRTGEGNDVLTPFFVSPHELQVTIPSPFLVPLSYATDGQLQLWVRNNDDKHVSNTGSLRVQPATDAHLKPRKPSITSISPYPVPLMDYRSPEVTILKLYGENFNSNDTIVADNGDSSTKLRTEFISPQELEAWLPREMWRRHRLSFELVAQRLSGICRTEFWQEQ